MQGSSEKQLEIRQRDAYQLFTQQIVFNFQIVKISSQVYFWYLQYTSAHQQMLHEMIWTQLIFPATHQNDKIITPSAFVKELAIKSEQLFS